MEREQGRAAWVDGMRVERVVLGHIVGELDSGVSRRRNEACIGNSGTWRREPAAARAALQTLGMPRLS